MKRWIFVLFVALSTILLAEPFERAEVTKAINRVSLLPRNAPAAPGDVVSGDSALKTGGNSRAELEFPDFTITRIGSNAIFRFVSGKREVILESGTLLFSTPEGAGGGKVRVGAITAAVTGTDFLVSATKGPAMRTVAMQGVAMQDLAKMAVNLASGTKDVAKQQAAIQNTAAQNASLAAKVANVTQNVAKQLPLAQDVANQAATMAAMQKTLKEVADKQEIASNVAAKQAANLATITKNFAKQDAGTQAAVVTQTNATQEAAKLDTTLDALTQGAAQQEVAAQKISELTGKVAAANQAVSQAITATQKAAAQQEALKLMADLQQAMNEQNDKLDAYTNMLAKQAALKDQIVQNMGGEASRSKPSRSKPP